MIAKPFLSAARVLMFLAAAAFLPLPAASQPLDGDIGGAVADSATGTPLPGGEVRILRGQSLVASAITDPFGR